MRRAGYACPVHEAYRADSINPEKDLTRTQFRAMIAKQSTTTTARRSKE